MPNLNEHILPDKQDRWWCSYCNKHISDAEVAEHDKRCKFKAVFFKAIDKLNRRQDMSLDAEMEQVGLGSIEWHCVGRHGVLRNVPKDKYWTVSRALTSYFGGKPNKGQWWIKNADGTYSVEFTHMTKVFPPPKEPWEWCGESVLFSEMAKIEQLRKQMKSLFSIGMKVKFNFKGQEEMEGIIVNKAKRAVIIVPGRAVKYYIPYSHLEMV